jgi:hypothetical protein
VPGTWGGGAACKVEVPPGSVHLFDAAAGARLKLREEA